jgi:hypothetical protein
VINVISNVIDHCEFIAVLAWKNVTGTLQARLVDAISVEASGKYRYGVSHR